MDNIKPLADAMKIHRGEYSSGGADYSVTTLIKPPRVVFLHKRHLHKVELFIEDQLHSFTGTAAHAYIEYCLRKSPGDWECETRLHDTILGRKISGAFDYLYKKKVLYDLKTTGVGSIIFGGHLEDWAAQQNMYRLLYWKKTGTTLKKLIIVGQFRDWSKWNLMRAGKPTDGKNPYPSYPAVEYEMPIWDFTKTQRWMEERVALMKQYESTHDDELPECTFDEMWADNDTVAVMSSRLKSKAKRVLNTQAEAEDYVRWYLSQEKCLDTEKTLSFQFRPGVRKRCQSWCPINKYCNQYQMFLKMKEELDES